MKQLGLIGGLSWHSTAEYYRLINENIQNNFGDLSSAPLILYSFNFEEIVALQKKNEWEVIQGKVIDAGRKLVTAGVDGVIFCANTTHRFADTFEKEISKPLIHIADATAKKINEAGIESVALLGTKLTMEMDFYKKRLEKWGIEALVPDANGIEEINSIIYDELCKGQIKDSSRETLKNIIGYLIGSGAEGVVLGCTELTLILNQKDFIVPTFDTALIHTSAAVDFMVG